MKSGRGVAVLGLALAAAGFVAWWGPSRAPAPDLAAEGGIEAIDRTPPSPAPPPSLAGQAPDRMPRDASGAPVGTGAGTVAGPGERGVRGRVLDAEGRPVRGAVVREVGAQDPAETATTDEDGRFVLARTDPASARLLVSAPGFADAVVAAGPGRMGFDVPLAKEWSISGTVCDAETGEPIVAVPVSATPVTSPEAADPRVATWSDTGTFRVTVPGAGAYVIDVGARYVGGGATVRDDWAPTRVEGVAAGTADLRVSLVRGRAIEGEIVDDLGARVMRRVTVDAVRRTAGGDPDYTMRKIVFAEGGILRVPGLPPGRYDLWMRPDADPTDAQGSPISSTVVRDVEAGTRGLVVRLLRGFVLTGRLEDGAGGAVTGPGALSAFPEGETARSHPIVGEVPGDGSFRIGPLGESVRYDLIATGFPGRRPGTVSGVSARDAGVVVVLVGARQIGGRVETEDGKPVPAGVPVGVVGEAIDPRVSGGRVFAYTAADGSFVADGLADLTFTVEAGGGRSGYLGAIAPGVKAGRTDLVLRVSVGVDLAGTLVDEHGEPVATTSLTADDGARVAAMRPYDQVGADGKFLLRGLRAGPVRLSIRIGSASVEVGSVDAPAKGLRVVVPAR